MKSDTSSEVTLGLVGASRPRLARFLVGVLQLENSQSRPPEPDIVGICLGFRLGKPLA
jgi:hypothetical protein